MFILELVLDDLAKEAREAPGWISLWGACNVALFPVFGISVRLGSIAEDRVMFATCASIVLFFVGDMLDILVFPRPQKDPERVEKLIRDLMIIFAAMGFFLLFARYWALGVMAWLPWAGLLPRHRSLTRAREDEKKKKRSNKQSIEQQDSAKQDCHQQEKEENESSGWKFLESTTLSTDRCQAINDLGLTHGGLYIITKALARKVDKYFWKPWLQNESGKFIRSTVFLVLFLGPILFVFQERVWGVIALVSSPALLLLYGRLKSWHMCALYRMASKSRSAETPYRTVEIVPGFLVFLYGDEPLAACLADHWQEIVRHTEQQPFPSRQMVQN